MSLCQFLILFRSKSKGSLRLTDCPSLTPGSHSLLVLTSFPTTRQPPASPASPASPQPSTQPLTLPGVVRGVGRGLWEPGIQLLCCENATGAGASGTVVVNSTVQLFASLNIQCCQCGFCIGADFILFILKFCDSTFSRDSLFYRLM